MRAGQLPVDEQVSYFQSALRRNPTLTEVLARATDMDLPGWYLVAGCLYQTVWNVVTGQPSWYGLTRCSRPATSTRPRPCAGGGNGRR